MPSCRAWMPTRGSSLGEQRCTERRRESQDGSVSCPASHYKTNRFMELHVRPNVATLGQIL